MLWPKKNSYKEFDNEKKFLRVENSHPRHNFSNGPSLKPNDRGVHLVVSEIKENPFVDDTTYYRP